MEIEIGLLCRPPKWNIFCNWRFQFMENITKWQETVTALLERSYRETVLPCTIQGAVRRYHISNKTIPNTNPKTNKKKTQPKNKIKNRNKA